MWMKLTQIVTETGHQMQTMTSPAIPTRTPTPMETALGIMPTPMMTMMGFLMSTK